MSTVFKKIRQADWKFIAILVCIGIVGWRVFAPAEGISSLEEDDEQITKSVDEVKKLLGVYVELLTQIEEKAAGLEQNNQKLSKSIIEIALTQCKQIYHSSQYDAATRISYAMLYKEIAGKGGDSKVANRLIQCKSAQDIDMCVKQAVSKAPISDKTKSTLYELVIEESMGRSK